LPATIVLVHGAFAESSSWNAVIGPLKDAGHEVIAVANPLRCVASDARYASDVVRAVDGPVVLVGHSYGGAVITNVDAGAGDVTALVYLAGFAADVGETAAELSNKFPGSTLADTLMPVPQDGGATDLYIKQDRYHEQFAADLPAAEAAQMAATQRPILAAAFDDPTDTPLWKSVPSWFMFGELDRNIPVASHRFMAERAGSRRTVEIAGASHVAGMAHPAELIGLITDAAGA
jgi:pimeloyl-ACP methyl ester carboxylesterase